MPSARVFGPWPEHSNPAASCLQWSCALQAEAVDTFFFFACAHLTRGRCCTSNLIAPINNPAVVMQIGDLNEIFYLDRMPNQMDGAAFQAATVQVTLRPGFARLN